jgi:hypothetical protein
MNKKIGSRKSSARQSARLGAYLAAGLGAAATTTSTTDAAIVNIDIGPSGFNIGGVNAGLAGAYRIVDNFPFTAAGGLLLTGGFYGAFWGIGPAPGGPGPLLAVATGGSLASPFNFSLNDTIGPTTVTTWDDNNYWSNTLFKSAAEGTFVSPDFGSGSYMGFRTAQSNYGWLEVTWTAASNQFEILSGAYEDQAGVAILAGQGAGPAAVPEPGTWAAAALLAGGAAFARWRKRRDEAQKEAA